MPYTSSVCGLALIDQNQGKEHQANKVIEDAIAFFLESGNTTLLPTILALQAEMALKQGRLSAASQWAENFDPVPPLAPMPYFMAPHLTLVKVWLAQNTSDSQRKAAQLLNQLDEYLASTHNTRFLIDTLALQALLEHANGDQTAAMAALEHALRLAQPGSFIRVFVDLGSEMADLLSQIKPDRNLSQFVERILAAFPEDQIQNRQSASRHLPEPLTNREQQILELLVRRLTNTEIAAQLGIAPTTVKGHTLKIYQKLEVNGRRQAVEKAITLGLLAPQ